MVKIIWKVLQRLERACNENNKLWKKKKWYHKPMKKMDSWERLDETIPNKKDFYSKFYLENITDKDYACSKSIWKI